MSTPDWSKAALLQRVFRSYGVACFLFFQEYPCVHHVLRCSKIASSIDYVKWRSRSACWVAGLSYESDTLLHKRKEAGESGERGTVTPWGLKKAQEIVSILAGLVQTRLIRPLGGGMRNPLVRNVTPNQVRDFQDIAWVYYGLQQIDRH